jgi:uncharacterized membrane protein
MKLAKRILVFLYAAMLLPQSALAIELPQRSAMEPLTWGSIGFRDMITRIANWVLWIAGVLAVIYLIYGGIIYITSAGNEDRAKAGKSAVLNAVIGLVVIFLSLLIVYWVRTIFSGIS